MQKPISFLSFSCGCFIDKELRTIRTDRQRLALMHIEFSMSVRLDQGWPTCGPFSLMLQHSTLALSYTSVWPFLWYCSALFPPPWLCASGKSSVHISLTFGDTRTISSSSFHLLMWMWSLPHQRCRWSSLICSAPMN